MSAKTTKKTKTPLTKAQGRLLKDSLQRLLGTTLGKERPVVSAEIRLFVLKEALNAQFLNKPLH